MVGGFLSVRKVDQRGIRTVFDKNSLTCMFSVHNVQGAYRGY